MPPEDPLSGEAPPKSSRLGDLPLAPKRLGVDTPTRPRAEGGGAGDDPGKTCVGPEDSEESAEFATVTPSTTKTGGVSNGATAIKLMLDGLLPRLPKVGIADAGLPSPPARPDPAATPALEAPLEAEPYPEATELAEGEP